MSGKANPNIIRGIGDTLTDDDQVITDQAIVAAEATVGGAMVTVTTTTTVDMADAVIQDLGVTDRIDLPMVTELVPT